MPREYVQSVQLLRFRLEHPAASDGRVEATDVERRGRSITGFIAEGDPAAVRGTAVDGLIRAKQVRNQSTGALVRRTPDSLAGKIVAVIVLSLLAAGFIAVAVVLLLLVTGAIGPH
jgi:hypothetical protein